MPGLNATCIFIRTGAILGCLVLGAVYTLAQTGGITGKITDGFGAVIAGAEIKAVILSSGRHGDCLQGAAYRTQSKTFCSIAEPNTQRSGDPNVLRDLDLIRTKTLKFSN